MVEGKVGLATHLGEECTDVTAPTIEAPPVDAPAGPTGRSVRLLGRTYAVQLPRLADPRVHVAAVIVSVQVLGQVVFGFDLSIAQILVCLVTVAVLEVLIVAVTTTTIGWPASALLTGNGVALILRTPGTEHGDWWSLNGWPIFLAAAGVSLLSKYAIQVGGRHVFNPSNFGLVVVFLLFGSAYADPQDLWWGPWSAPLVATLALILVGGCTLARRLRLFTVALTFWVTFAAGIAVLAAGGHAISARWHVGPVGGWAYWLVLVTSPEIVIFVFFMITDPRTAPIGRVARPVYAAAVGVVAALLASFQRTEFATKVSLLAALTIVCAVRPLLERWLPDGRFTGPGGRWWRAGPVRAGAAGPSLRPTPAGLAVVAVAAVALTGILAMSGARTTARGVEVASVDRAAAGRRPTVRLDASAVPIVTVDRAVRDLAGALDEGDAARLGRDVVADLAIEADALRRRDPALAATASFGERLADLRARIRDAGRTGRRTVPRYEVERIEVVLLRDPVNPQSVPQLGARVRGRATDLTYEGSGTGQVAQQRSRAIDQLFLVTEIDGHQLIGAEIPVASPMLVGGA